MGVDLLHQTAAGLKAKGVPDSIVQKMDKFFGKNKAQVEAAGLDPESLTLDETELQQLNNPMIAEVRVSRNGLEWMHYASVRGRVSRLSLTSGQNQFTCAQWLTAFFIVCSHIR